MTISIDIPHAEPAAVKDVLDWIELQSRNLRTLLGRMKMLSKMDTATDVVITQEGRWVEYITLSVVTISPRFILLQDQFQRESMELSIIAKFGVRAPSPQFMALPSEGVLALPVGQLNRVHTDVYLKQLH